jgi:hypothetical protein
MAVRREAHQVRENIARGKHRVPYTLKVGDIIHGFKITNIDRIDLFDITAYKLEHL